MKAKIISDLKLLLEHRLRLIADHHFRDENPGEHLNALQQVSESLSVWHSQHSSDIDGNLNHFLHGASYSKALDYIETGLRQPCS